MQKKIQKSTLQTLKYRPDAKLFMRGVRLHKARKEPPLGKEQQPECCEINIFGWLRSRRHLSTGHTEEREFLEYPEHAIETRERTQFRNTANLAPEGEKATLDSPKQILEGTMGEIKLILK